MRVTSRQFARRCGLEEHTIEFEIFCWSVSVIVGPWKGVEEYVRWKFNDKTYDVGTYELGDKAVVFRHRPYSPVMWFPSRPKTTRELARVPHEFVHAIRMLADQIGMGHMTEDTDEFYAYCIEHGVRETFKAFGIGRDG